MVDGGGCDGEAGRQWLGCIYTHYIFRYRIHKRINIQVLNNFINFPSYFIIFTKIALVSDIYAKKIYIGVGGLICTYISYSCIIITCTHLFIHWQNKFLVIKLSCGLFLFESEL